MLKEERHNVYTAVNFAIGQSLFVWGLLEINCHTIKTTHQFDLLNLWSFVDVPLCLFLSSRPRTELATTYIAGHG